MNSTYDYRGQVDVMCMLASRFVAKREHMKAWHALLMAEAILLHRRDAFTREEVTRNLAAIAPAKLELARFLAHRDGAFAVH